MRLAAVPAGVVCPGDDMPPGAAGTGLPPSLA
jgi:hypothetical protein